ncbi:MAG: DUF3572 domain-containing protein [Pseudomonadota bacterium]
MQAANSNDDPQELALRALVCTLAEPMRGFRLLETTGLTPQDLRERASDPAVLAAVLGFLEAHEPDLIDCATTLGVPPGELVAAHRILARQASA